MLKVFTAHKVFSIFSSLFFIFVFSFLNKNVFAKGLYEDLETEIGDISYKIIFISLIFLTILILISLKNKKHSERNKKYLFSLILIVIILPTIFLIFSTIYLNTISSSKGPVHWHADFEIWACGKEIDLVDPVGLSNKIGTPTLHEHNDKRIHLEGVVLKPNDASLGKFFYVIGGSLNTNTLRIPTTTGIQEYTSGQSCPDGQKAYLQVFLYSTQDGTYTQHKLADPQNYIIAPHSQVPPGDCIIIEYGPLIDRTEKLCRSYKVAEKIGKVRKGD